MLRRSALRACPTLPKADAAFGRFVESGSMALDNSVFAADLALSLLALDRSVSAAANSLSSSSSFNAPSSLLMSASNAFAVGSPASSRSSLTASRSPSATRSARACTSVPSSRPPSAVKSAIRSCALGSARSSSNCSRSLRISRSCCGSSRRSRRSSWCSWTKRAVWNTVAKERRGRRSLFVNTKPMITSSVPSVSPARRAAPRPWRHRGNRIRTRTASEISGDGLHHSAADRFGFGRDLIRNGKVTKLPRAIAAARYGLYQSAPSIPYHFKQRRM